MASGSRSVLSAIRGSIAVVALTGVWLTGHIALASGPQAPAEPEAWGIVSSQPQRPHLPPWLEVLMPNATDPDGEVQSWDPSTGGLPILQNPTFGPSSGVIVDLSPGSEAYLPEPDQTGYNPSGNKAVFARSYRSDLALKGICSPGLSPGWVHNYDLILIQSPKYFPAGSVVVRYPNNVFDILPPEQDAAGKLTGCFGMKFTVPLYATAVPSKTAVGKWESITIHWQDMTEWRFVPADSAGPNGETIYTLSQLGDLVFTWDAQRRLQTISSSRTPGKPIFTFAYDPTTGLLGTLTDFGNRQIRYGFQTPPKDAGMGRKPLLISESQVHLVGQKVPDPAFCAYGYIAGATPGTALLNAIHRPDPNGAPTYVTAQIRYKDGRVAAHIDANKNEHTYTYLPNGTRVDVKDKDGVLVTFWTMNIDAAGRFRGRTDAAGHSTHIGYTTDNPTPTTGGTGKGNAVPAGPAGK